MSTGLRIKRKGLKTSSGRLLPVARITALITLLPSVLIPGILPAGHAAAGTITYNASSASASTIATNPTTNTSTKGDKSTTLAGYTLAGWCTNPLSPGATCASVSGNSYGFAVPAPTVAADTTVNLYAVWSANTVTWNDQGATTASSGGSATYSVSGGGATTGTASLISAIPTSPPQKTYFTFAGWYTSANGLGTQVTAGSYTPPKPFGPITLYAKWTANKYVYNGTSAVGATQDQTYDGEPLPARSNGFTEPDYYSFGGWCTVSITNPGDSCSGTTYAANSELPNPLSSTVTLWAIWNENKITFDPNGGAWGVGDDAYDGEDRYSSSGVFYLGGAAPTKNGHDFAGWNTLANGSGTLITELGEEVTLSAAGGPVTLYAQWTANQDNEPVNLTVTYNSQSGSAISNGSTSTGGSIASSPGTPTRSGYTFNGWFAASTGGSAITFPYTHAQTANFTLYAQWTADQADNTNTVTWNGQGATTASSGGSTTYTNGSSVSTIPTTAPQKTGHTFVGWFTAASSGKQITNGSFTPASPYVNQTFYAHWTVNRTSSVGTWAWTNQSSAGARKWHALATSADGSKLYAGVDDGGSLYRSTDSGVTWSVIANTSGKNWFSIASNIDGTKVAAVDRGGHMWTSTDSGSTWTQRSVGAVRNWESIASSSDGTKLVAVASNGDSNGFIYTSSNSGVTWSSNLAPAGTNKFTGVASSNDGTYLAATTWANGIYTSSNSGQTWTARTLPVPNSDSTTYLQAVASSGDGSRLVTGSRTLAGGSNGGVIFTSADYGVTWKAFSQTNLDYINFTSNGDGSRLAATVYDQTGVSTSADYGATWSFQSVGLSGEIPIASNIDGSLLFVGAYGGNLWTGKIPNARVAAVLPASTTAALAATASTPATALSFSASSAAAALTVTPIANPATEAATPFSAAQASVFDISVVNVTGQVTVCVDGGPNVRLWHYTNGAWVDVTTSQTATQTCGLTSSFSPFATALSVAVLLPVTDTVSNAGAERREAEKQSARTEIASTLQSAKDLTVESFTKAEIPGVTAKNLAAVQAEILALPEESRADINQILKVARKFEVVGNIASNQVMRMTSTSFVEIGLIPASSKNKVALMAAIRKLPTSARDTYAEIKAAIDAETARIKSRNDRLAAIINRKTTKSTQK